MKTALAALALAGLLAAAGPAPAGDMEFFDGQELALQCQAKPETDDYAIHNLQCRAYILGVSDSQQAAQGAGQAQRVCLVDGVRPAELEGKVKAYLEAHPDKLAMAAHDLVLNALGEAYPCK